ncbi:hypothetical protein FGIG_06717 [Fasciola gigantica]|uniref:Uncharacterized protein n=1 Tax=Fasciola gigantica TaxID=46835 RepID=A0A504YIH3_FASGI|nr:hypothetical protein FGIG_06717 [Fasciola gigantica]
MPLKFDFDKLKSDAISLYQKVPPQVQQNLTGAVKKSVDAATKIGKEVLQEQKQNIKQTLAFLSKKKESNPLKSSITAMLKSLPARKTEAESLSSSYSASQSESDPNVVQVNIVQIDLSPLLPKLKQIEDKKSDNSEEISVADKCIQSSPCEQTAVQLPLKPESPNPQNISKSEDVIEPPNESTESIPSANRISESHVDVTNEQTQEADSATSICDSQQFSWKIRDPKSPMELTSGVGTMESDTVDNILEEDSQCEKAVIPTDKLCTSYEYGWVSRGPETQDDKACVNEHPKELSTDLIIRPSRTCDESTSEHDDMNEFCDDGWTVIHHICIREPDKHEFERTGNDSEISPDVRTLTPRLGQKEKNSNDTPQMVRAVDVPKSMLNQLPANEFMQFRIPEFSPSEES